MRLLALALLLACAPPPRAPQPPLAANAVRLVTWNVHDLFDAEDQVTPPGAADTVLTPAEVEAKLERLATVLARLDADVVAVQEVENRPLLERLARRLGGDHHAVLEEAFDPRGIDVGLLTRWPVTAVVSHGADRATDGSHLFARDLLEVHLATGERPLVVVVAHLVSRLDPASDPRRRAQAERAREVVEEAAGAPDAPLVVLAGDLNDAAGSQTLAPLFADGGLADAGAVLGAEGWTWRGQGRVDRLDYLLLRRPEEAAVLRVEVASGEDVLAASDHRPLVADLWLGRSTHPVR
jgi:endonuclease/exonuclease/phosphatase family metal-dependent hydrolase